MSGAGRNDTPQDMIGMARSKVGDLMQGIGETLPFLVCGGAKAKAPPMPPKQQSSSRTAHSKSVLTGNPKGESSVKVPKDQSQKTKLTQSQVDWDKSGQKTLNPGNNMKTASSTVMPVPKDVFHCPGSQIEVIPYIGDIIKADADILVTSEVVKLGAKSKITKSLCALDNGGQTFEEKRNELLNSVKLSPGDVHKVDMRSCGNFPFKFVLHAIMKFNLTEDNLLILLTEVLTTILSQTDQEGSLAIPLIGTGRRNVDPDKIIETIVKTLNTFSRTHQKLDKVFLVTLKRGLHEQTLKHCQNYLTRVRGTTITDPGFDQSMSAVPSPGRPRLKIQWWETKKGDLAHKGASAVDRMEPSLNRAMKSLNIGQSDDGPGSESHTTGNTYSGEDNDKDSDDVVSTVSGQGEDKPLNLQTNEDEETCPICCDAISDAKILSKCGHIFCRECIDSSFKCYKPVCPVCQTPYGLITGNMPPGIMSFRVDSFPSLPGYEGWGFITVDYQFRNGIQTSRHPHPGQSYRGTSRTAYLPNNPEGRTVLKLLRLAFDRKLSFTVGRSATTGRENCVIWNDIHHKTSLDGGPTHFGYPDDTYLSRVKEELASKGITEDQI